MEPRSNGGRCGGGEASLLNDIVDGSVFPVTNNKNEAKRKNKCFYINKITIKLLNGQ